MTNELDDIINIAKNKEENKQHANGIIPEEFFDFVNEVGLVRDPEHFIKFKHVYWLYLKWRGGDKKAIKRVRFGRFLAKLFQRQSRDRFYIGPKELFKKDRKERRLQKLQQEKETCLKRQKTKLLRKLLAQGRIDKRLAKTGRIKYLKGRKSNIQPLKKDSIQE